MPARDKCTISRVSMNVLYLGKFELQVILSRSPRNLKINVIFLFRTIFP